ncbi:MAG: c-type cytochrome [Rhodoblastus sp.]|nr:c-type cytochrome [Rhodoblastus sp.]
MRRALAALLVLGLAGGIAGWLLTAPRPLNSATIVAMPADNAVQGETIFWAGGCASCHAAPGADGDARLVLAGGLELGSPFGTFVAPNISPSKEHGIGAWNLAAFANAMLAGVGPDGGHLYPAFPYASYSNMTHQDVSDLFAFLKTLPVSENVPGPNRLPFPFSIRRAVGGWKLLFFNGLAGNPRPDIDLSDPVVARGSYLVNGPGHCGECHTPRNLIGGWKSDAWLSGAKNPEGEGRIPNITPGGGIKDWSADDIASYLETGFTPDFDSVGGSMVAVQKNMAHLTKEDRAAIAAYLKAIPARPDGA